MVRAICDLRFEVAMETVPDRRQMIENQTPDAAGKQKQEILSRPDADAGMAITGIRTGSFHLFGRVAPPWRLEAPRKSFRFRNCGGIPMGDAQAALTARSRG